MRLQSQDSVSDRHCDVAVHCRARQSTFVRVSPARTVVLRRLGVEVSHLYDTLTQPRPSVMIPMLGSSKLSPSSTTVLS